MDRSPPAAAPRFRGAAVWLAAALAVSAAVADGFADSPRKPSGRTAMETQDRDVPRPKAVSAGGVRYEVMRNARMRGFEQSGGVVAAVDVKSKTELWTLKVYTVKFDPAEERDVQEVFITALKVDPGGRQLTVTNERGETYRVDTATRAVTALGK